MRNKSKEYLDKKLRKLLLWQMKVDSILSNRENHFPSKIGERKMLKTFGIFVVSALCCYATTGSPYYVMTGFAMGFLFFSPLLFFKGEKS